MSTLYNTDGAASPAVVSTARRRLHSITPTLGWTRFRLVPLVCRRESSPLPVVIVRWHAYHERQSHAVRALVPRCRPINGVVVGSPARRYPRLCMCRCLVPGVLHRLYHEASFTVSVEPFAKISSLTPRRNKSSGTAERTFCIAASPRAQRRCEAEASDKSRDGPEAASTTHLVHRRTGRGAMRCDGRQAVFVHDSGRLGRHGAWWGLQLRSDQGGRSHGATASELDAQFLVNTGDNFYWCGIISTEDFQVATDYLDVYTADPLQGMPWYSVLGNHEYGYNVSAQIALTYTVSGRVEGGS